MRSARGHTNDKSFFERLYGIAPASTEGLGAAQCLQERWYKAAPLPPTESQGAIVVCKRREAGRKRTHRVGSSRCTSFCVPVSIPVHFQYNKRHRSRSRNGARDPQCVVSSDDEPFAARSVAFTDLDATMTTVLSSNASSQALARVQPFSGAEEDGNDGDQLCIGQQEDLEGTHVRRKTRRVLSDDDLPLTQVLPAFSHLASRRVVLVPGASGDIPRSGPDRSDSGEDGDETQFAHHGVESHRRGLVVEVALNVVDATTVELPNSPQASVVDALEFDLSVPASHGFDEEDEFDAGVPTVPGPDRDRSRARDFLEEETARPTQLGGDDEPLVSAPSWVTRNRFAALQSFDHADEAPFWACVGVKLWNLTSHVKILRRMEHHRPILRSFPQCQSPPQLQQSVVDSCWSKEGAGARRVGDVSGSDTDSVVATDDEAMDERVASGGTSCTSVAFSGSTACRSQPIGKLGFGRDFRSPGISDEDSAAFSLGIIPHCSESGFGGNCQWCRQEK